MHWIPGPEIMYSKAHRGPELSILVHKLVNICPKGGKICPKSVKMGSGSDSQNC